MSEKPSLRVASLLASRLCHDLVGPLGAVDNGLELMADGGGMADEALALARRSSKRATGRLQFFRFAFGAAGADPKFGAAEARPLAQGFLQNADIALEWLPPGGEPVPAGTGQLLLNLLLLAVECLPRGGRIEVGVRARRLAVDSTGPQARMTPEVKSALLGSTPLSDLTARTIVGYFAAQLAAGLGGRLEVVEASPDRVRMQTALGPLRPF
ncbi:MAG TPA: histidine phosphotransferase family protein [Dongiaceae bacterium]|nr:histidine phosphotransferase family protein [Dongiaceae bacterium]